MQVVMVRHGESLWNVERRYQGQTDSGLTPRGREQAALAAQLLLDEMGPLETVWSSDLPRARDTAQAYADLTGATVIEDARLREIDVGDWEGRRVEEIAEEFPEVISAFREGQDPPRGGGETFAELRARVAEFLDELSGRDQERALVFSHGGAIQMAAAHAAHSAAPGNHRMAGPENCSRTVVRISGPSTAVVHYNLPLPAGAGAPAAP